MRFQKVFTLYLILIISLLGLSRCHDTIDMPSPGDQDLTKIPYQPIPYVPVIPSGFPALEQPADNPMTVDGIRLGRKLFYDPILSIDSTVSCSTCHQQKKSFTDNLPFSPGVAGNTNRSSLSLINVGLEYHGLFWDGRAPTLEDQAIQPVQNVIEMGETWDNVENKLKRHHDYPSDFRKAFGISNSSMITRELVTKAIAQFERTILSDGNSRYDRFVRGEILLEENEYTGYLMFFNVLPGELPDAQCFHCHSGPLIGTTDYFNNGLQEAAFLKDFKDKGLGGITGDSTKNGFFKAPTLRNVAFTAPYMHDGQFQTLDQVMNHYMTGGKSSPNKNPFLNQVHLTESQKSDVIAFILTMTDSSILTNPAFKSPF